jgi:RNA polymerase sigma-70 factor (ECF subfamily)
LPAYNVDIEKEWLLLIAQGDENAFRQLFHHYHHHLAQYIFQITASREMAEEIVQDVFLKIWTTRDSLAHVQSFQAWLFTLSKNHALNALRTVVREKAKAQRWSVHHAHMAITEEAAFTEAAASTEAEHTALLEQAIHQLPGQQKKVLILSRYHHLKYNEIAQKMNISRETVKSYLRIAMVSITKYVTNRSLFGWLLLFLHW